MTIDKKCVVEFKGRRIDPDKISNPKLAKVFRERVHNGEQFLFNYGDHTDKSKRYGDHSEHSEYSDHHDHRDRHKDCHNDNSNGGWEHTDCNEWGTGKHQDYTGPSSYQDHSDSHTDRDIQNINKRKKPQR